ncbi:Wadjet anti-phage system protein JetA family protein [Columbia Basin potato purple top phytoplasma]|uniref:DUF5716 family protein n=1 Tax=Columbia Basin potato purple top phytoplasma TaxID=307134 RepID=A0ABT5L963_9MOLU|nr:Wadjet anti-phage system protein JetA family protein [Columbia Basin potato purple top phytoplasma]MDC9032141.1 DUF5716 family protein [Columbia Basin potato purple top phytoplasma]
MSSYLFKIIPSNFFQLLSSVNKDIYIDCLLILEKLVDEDDDFNIKKNIALNSLEKYFVEKNRILFQEEINKQDFVIDNRQKASQVLTSLYKHGWIGEEKISYNITNIHFFDYSLEMIYFFQKNIYQAKPESIGNIYSVYSLLKSFLVEKNYTSFQESLLKTKSLLVKLKILKTSIFRFYNQLINLNFNYNLQNVLEQLLLDYKKNFFDSSYFILKTTDNFLKYCIQINLFLKEIETNPIYFQEMNNQLKKINKNSPQMNINLIKKQIQEIKTNLISTDKLINIIDQKNEQYLETACTKILFFDNQKKNTENLLNYLIKLILNQKIDASSFINLWNIKNLDDLSFYKPRVKRLEMMTSMLDVIPEDIELNLKDKKKSILEKKDFLTHKNINLFVKKYLNQKQTLKASEIILKTNHDIARLILIYIYARSNTYDNVYQIKKLNVKVNSYNFSFFDFLIFKK